MTNITRLSSGMPRYSSGRMVPTVGLSDGCQIDHCGKDAAEGVGIKLCVNHLRKAYAAYMIVSAADADIDFREPAPKRDEQTPELIALVHWKHTERAPFHNRIRD